MESTEGYDKTELKALNSFLQVKIETLDTDEQSDIYLEDVKHLNETVLSDYDDLTDEGKALFIFLIDSDPKSIDEITDIEVMSYDYYGSPMIEVNSEEYAVIEDDSIESVFHDYVENLIDDVIIPDLPERYQQYFDYDKMIRDMSFDGYGQMSSYDGEDQEVKLQGKYYHILRMN
jgi:hypothetical protein